ncbi:sialate O-acetylesterase [bacterium]|nr:sialate O-acetylesterase [bacterium]
MALGIALGIPFRAGSGAGGSYPSDLLQWLVKFPATGTETEFVDRVGTLTNAVAVESPCLTFAAAHGQYGLTRVKSPTTSFIASIGFNTTTASAGTFFGSGGVSSDQQGVWVRLTSGAIQLRIARGTVGVYAIDATAGSGFNDGLDHELSLYFGRQTYRAIVTVDDVEIINQLALSDFGTDTKYYAFGADNEGATLNFTGNLWDFKLTNRADIPACEKSGITAYNTEVTAGEEIEVIMSGGQSNWVDPISGAPPAEYDIDQTDYIYIYDIDNGTYAGTDSALHKLTTNTWGAEIVVGKELTDQYGSKPRAFIKFAVNGQTMDTFAHGGINYPSLSRIINRATDELKALGYVPNITNFVWMQGEPDALTEVLADAYYTNFYSMWDNLIIDTAMSDDTKLIIGRVNVPLRSFRATVRGFQDTLGSELGATIDTDLFDLNVDDVHYTDAGIISLGKAIAPLIADYDTVGPTSVKWPDADINVGTGDEATMWNANTQPKLHYFLENGGCIDTGVYIPALQDGSACADGSPIENIGGYVHNGAPTGVLQTSNILLDKPIFSDDGVTFKPVTYADLQAHVNGSYNVFLQWIKKNGVLQVKEWRVFPSTKVWTEETFLQAIGWATKYTTEGGAGALEIAYDLDGTPQINLDGSLELVQPN